MRTTVDLPDELFQRVKARAALRGMKLREFIAEALQRALAGEVPTPRRVRLPLVKGDGTHVINPSRGDLDASLWD
ncbi:MAG TPA: hypothetical protein VGD78_02740 [Chthoniobacterales bacterium]